MPLLAYKDTYIPNLSINILQPSPSAFYGFAQFFNKLIIDNHS